MSHQRQEQLSRIVIKGFKSIKECEIELNNINVLIGSNGAGKSNLISVFELLQAILERELSFYVAKKGVNSLFYNGTKITDSILTEFYFGLNSYAFELEMSENNSLIFREERIETESLPLGDGGYRESKWQELIKKANIDKHLIDEPELGLHPFAITIIAELVKKTAVNKQIILSTQSVEFLNHFNAEDIIVADRSENGSEFRRLDAAKLAEWLEDDYTLGELWNKNILGDGWQN